MRLSISSIASRQLHGLIRSDKVRTRRAVHGEGESWACLCSRSLRVCATWQQEAREFKKGAPGQPHPLSRHTRIYCGDRARIAFNRVPVNCARDLRHVHGLRPVVFAPCRDVLLGPLLPNFQELGVSPDQRRKARVKALSSEKPSAFATSETEAPVLRSR